MNDTNANDWGNYWQGRAATEAGAALVGVGVETNTEIAAFWKDRFKTLAAGTKIVDLACGAGSVTRRAAALNLIDVTGVDISADAITALKAEFPKANAVVASADATGLPSSSFDVVASQFGFEYANAIKAATEAARILKPGGQFIALSHSEGSGIDVEVSRHGNLAKAVLKSGFIAAAKEIFRSDMGGEDGAAFAQAVQNFKQPQAEVLAIAKTAGGLAAHLYEGTQKLYERRRSYALRDVNGWLDGMEAEISAYAGRMDSMQAAALSIDEAAAVLQTLERGGLTPQPLEKFKSKATGDVIGWIICATDKGA